VTQPSEQLITDFRRYADIIAARLHDTRPPQPTIETADTLQVDRGAMLALAVRGETIDPQAVDRLVEWSTTTTDRLATIGFVDAAGHARPVYRPLMIYAWLMSYRIAYESLPPSTFGRWDESLRPWCDLLEAALGDIGVSESATPASRGGAAAEAAWTALALYIAGKIFVRDA